MMDAQVSIEHEKKWKANSEPRTLPKNDSKNETNDACHDHFRIDKEQSMLADCQRLYERNEPLDKPDKYGITLLHIAAAKAYSTVVRFLLQHHVTVDQVDDTGATALHLCAKHEQGLIVKLLLDARANPTIRDRFGRKPSEVCISNSFIRAVLLKSEIKFEEKRKRAEQSDDSLEEEHEQTFDSLSDEEEDHNDDDAALHVLFNPIPQKQQIFNSDLFNDVDDIKIMEIFDDRLYDNTLTLLKTSDQLEDVPDFYSIVI